MIVPLEGYQITPVSGGIKQGCNGAEFVRNSLCGWHALKGRVFLIVNDITTHFFHGDSK